jgi:hypothetical protein
MSGFALFVFWEALRLRVRLHILKRDKAAEYPVGKRFGFAVVDLDRAEGYPSNFVCMLPMRININGQKISTFEKKFGDRSLDLAKNLLNEALKSGGDPEIKGEIERRLRLLDAERRFERVCVSCGRVFKTEHGRSFRKKFCEDCLRKKFGSRE